MSHAGTVNPVHIFRDISQGHSVQGSPTWPRSKPIQGAARTYADGLLVVRKLDRYEPHTRCWDTGGYGEIPDHGGGGWWGSTAGGTGGGGSDLPFVEGEDTFSGSTDFADQDIGDFVGLEVVIDTDDNIDSKLVGYLAPDGKIRFSEKDLPEDQESFVTGPEEVSFPTDLTSWSTGLLLDGTVSQSFPQTENSSQPAQGPSTGTNTSFNDVFCFDEQTHSHGRLEYTTDRQVSNEDIIKFEFYHWAGGSTSFSTYRTNKIFFTHSENSTVTQDNSFITVTFGRDQTTGLPLVFSQPGEGYTGSLVSLSFEDNQGPASTNPAYAEWVKVTLEWKKPVGSPSVPGGSTIKLSLGQSNSGNAFSSYSMQKMEATQVDDGGGTEGGPTVTVAASLGAGDLGPPTEDGPTYGGGLSPGDDPQTPQPCCKDNCASNYNPNPWCIEDTSLCEYPECCTDPEAINYCGNDAECGCVTCIPNNDICEYDNTVDKEEIDTIDPDVEPIYGCTQSWADNYDANANTDDGTCYKEGCTNENARNYDSFATVDDGSCEYGNILGEPVGDGASLDTEDAEDVPSKVCCGAEGAINKSEFCPPSQRDDSICIFPEDWDCEGDDCPEVPKCCTSEGAINQTDCPPLQHDEGLCIYPQCCKDLDAINSCLAEGLDCDTCEENPEICRYFDVIDGGGIGTDGGVTETDPEVEIIPGCTNSNCGNYNPYANADDGSCWNCPGDPPGGVKGTDFEDPPEPPGPDPVEGDDFDIDEVEDDHFCVTHWPKAWTGEKRTFAEGRQMHRAGNAYAIYHGAPVGDWLDCQDRAGPSVQPSRVWLPWDSPRYAAPGTTTA